jgi:signal transduction histidine kinase
VRTRSVSFPIRLQLTLVLVLLVAALSISLTYISYRAARRSLEDEALASLESTAEARVHVLDTFSLYKAERLASAAKSLELACGASGAMNLPCAKENLRIFLAREQARAAILTYGNGKQAVFGDYFGAEHPTARSAAFHRDAKGELYLAMGYVDEDSGLNLDVQFSSSPVVQAVLSEVAQPVGAVATADGQPWDIPTGRLALTRSAALDRCLNGEAASALEGSQGQPVYRVYRYASGLGVCVIAEKPQAIILAPITRLTRRLTNTVLGFVIVSMLVAYLLGHILTHPLAVMKRRVAQLKKGDFDSPVPIVGTGEIKDFSTALASMASALKASRVALLESERKLTLAHKAGRLWIWNFNLKTGTFSWQIPWKRGSGPHLLPLRKVLRSIDERDRHAVVGAIRQAKSSKLFEVEYRPKRVDGHETWVAAWGELVQDEAGLAVSITGVSLNSTSRKEQQRLISEREKLLATADMAASLAHEINNPLSSVIGALYMATTAATVPPESRHYLDVAGEEADRIARIARQMLSLYRKPSVPESVDVRHLLQDVISSCRAQAERKQQRLEVAVENTGSICGFADELRQAFTNLVVNAIEHSPRGAHIAIRAHRSHSFQRVAERGVRVLVANTTEPAAIRKSMDLTAAFVTTKKQRGAGLGLWVTRSVLLKHGGNLRVRAYGENSLCCAVYLPARSIAA